MGGNAIKTVKVSRLSKQLHSEITQRIINTVPNSLPSINYPDKTTFGDVDIYVKIDNTLNSKVRNDLLRSYIESVGGLIESLVERKNIKSFAILYEDGNYYQVDFNLTDDLEFAQFFYAYGYISQIIYKMLHSVNLSYTNKGLHLELNQRTVKFIKDINCPEFKKELLISKNPPEICEKLGLSYSRFLEGFVTKEDIFDWLSTMKYYRRIYQREFGKLTILIIDDLILYQEGKDIVKKYGTSEECIKQLIDEYNLHSKLNEIINTVCRAELIRSKFSFQKFLDVGYTKSEIGNAMQSFKLSKGDQFDEYILIIDDEELIREIQRFRRLSI